METADMTVSPAISCPVILYDLSELASLPYSERGLTGVQRAVVEIASRLTSHPSFTLRFSTLCRRVDTMRGVERIEALSGRYKQEQSLTSKALVWLYERAVPNAADIRQRALLARIRAKMLRVLDERVFTRYQRPPGLAALTHYPGLTAVEMPPRTPGSQRAVSIYDLLPLEFPTLVPPIEVKRVQTLLSRLDRDDWIICNSIYVQGQILQHSTARSDRVRVVPLAADLAVFHPNASMAERDVVKARYGIPGESYLLTLNATSQRKNLQLTLDVFGELVEQGLYAGMLAVAGMDRQQWEALPYSSNIRKLIIPIDGVREEDLAALYSGAEAFLFPSLAEGFGLPPLEAMQCGCPVISSNRTSLPEVIGDGALLLAPEVQYWKEAVYALLKDPMARQDWSARGKRQAKKFSWDRTGDAIAELYLEAMA